MTFWLQLSIEGGPLLAAKPAAGSLPWSSRCARGPEAGVNGRAVAATFISLFWLAEPARVVAFQVETELKVLNLAYTCIGEEWHGDRLHSKTRVFYNRGRFREEYIDPRTGKTRSMTVYNHDGQGLPFYYYEFNASPREAGVTSDGVMYRLAKSDPEAYRRRIGVPPGAKVVEGGRKPGAGLLQFEPHPYWKLRKVGTERVDGKLCDVYEPGTLPGQRTKVWRGYILESERHGANGVQRRRITGLKFVPRLDPKLFELLPGTIVKVPADLKVRLPKNVRRLEYPGNGISGKGRSASPPLRGPNSAKSPP